MTVPEPKLRRIPPAALVRITVPTPSRAKTRTGSAVSDAGWPSYMWNRPLCTSTVAALRACPPPARRCGRSPSAPGSAGSRRTGSAPRRSAARRTGPGPSPARWPTVGVRPPSRARTASAASSIIAVASDAGIGGLRRGHSRIPAIVAERKFASVPASIARRPSRARSRFRSGASAPMPPSWMPTELKLAKPARANDAIVNDRGSSCRLHRPELREGDELVQHHARAQQAPDRAAVVPRHAHGPRDRAEDPAERRSAGWRGTSRRSGGARRSRR